MIVKISIAVAALLFSGANAVIGNYNNASIAYFRSLDCTSCMRGGYNYCMEIGGPQTETKITYTCDNKSRNPERFIDNSDPSGVANGYICSNAAKDQMNAIINACRPWYNQNTKDDCGSYFVDLTQRSDLQIGRSVKEFPVNSSCTYRVMSTCGYPEAAWRVNDPRLAEDFDIAYASYDGLLPTQELDGWEFDLTTNWRGSYASSLSMEYTQIRRPNQASVSDDQWTKCNGMIRNLYVTITRVKNSTRANFERTERQLQFYPNGTKQADFDITFSTWRGAATLLKVVSVAFAASLAALAF